MGSTTRQGPEGEVLSDEHRIGAVTVHPDLETALSSIAADEGEGASSFLKEQQ